MVLVEAFSIELVFFSLARHSVANNRNSYEFFGAWHDLILPFVSLPVKCYCVEKGPHSLCGLSDCG